MERKNSPLPWILLGHLLVTAWTWRDIKRRPARRIRGSKGLWRFLTAINTLGSVGYWALGRRYGRPELRERFGMLTEGR
jgi:hypothetical protein